MRDMNEDFFFSTFRAGSPGSSDLRQDRLTRVSTDVGETGAPLAASK